MKQTAPAPVPRPKLARFIWERMLDLKDVGASLGCSHEQVRVICRPFDDSARRVPGPDLMARIVEWTGGEVTPADFYPAYLSPAREPTDAPADGPAHQEELA